MSEIRKETYKINFDKEARKEISKWIMVEQLNSQVNARLGRGKWYATRYYSHEENDGSLTFFVEVEEVK